ncbi:glycosyltransferase family 2 protein [Streptomyces sp. FIT100]|uniref:Putative glycosyl-transferase n=1 Tax=Streptomyces rochei TaxID=1928 RepID=Q9L3U3_STRRO|nr:glycosyltransferase [Streptomyces sp. FIT100]UUN29694.1 glycosyltransferase [Streptomyces sp. FIT100]CAB67719.1 putative glycosyl-transferase [Streptomyces rochei]
MANDPVDEAVVDKGVARTSVVIALRDDLRIADCIASIDEDVEIVLALNGPSDAVLKLIADHPRPLTVTEIDDVGNLGAAYNAGAAATDRQYLLLMDSDCVFAPGVVRAMVRAVLTAPVVKGQVVYGESDGVLSKLTARVREFDEGDYISALSPPLIYNREIVGHIGGYHFDELIHWCEDREFDFRLQLAGIPVVYLPEARIFHDAQHGFANMRSYFRYGVGEGIAQETGVFTTPAVPVVWRLFEASRTLAQCARVKGVGAAAYYGLLKAAFHTGTVHHLLNDPYEVRDRYPVSAKRTRMVRSIPQHSTRLTKAQMRRLRRAHWEAGRRIERVADLSVFHPDAAGPDVRSAADESRQQQA